MPIRPIIPNGSRTNIFIKNIPIHTYSQYLRNDYSNVHLVILDDGIGNYKYPN